LVFEFEWWVLLATLLKGVMRVVQTRDPSLGCSHRCQRAAERDYTTSYQRRGAGPTPAIAQAAQGPTKLLKRGDRRAATDARQISANTYLSTYLISKSSFVGSKMT